MKSFLKKIVCTAIIAVISVVFGCKKNATTEPATNTTTPSGNTDNYSSMSDFFATNGVAMQTYTVTGSAGGTFTTPQGTVVTIPANAFLNSSSQVVTGAVNITFKDIYKKSDMLLSNIAATTYAGTPLKSGGEFYIKATSGSNVLTLANTITVKQPLNSTPADVNMQSFTKPGNATAWMKDSTTGHVTVDTSLTYTVYSLIQMCNPLDSGSWCNSDDPSYFSSYTQGTLILQETDTAFNYNTLVYLLFTGINTTDACHTPSGNNFNYANCVPVGLQCTAVAVGVKNGKLYSSFTPITITSNQTVNFSMTETTTAAFKTALEALN